MLLLHFKHILCLHWLREDVMKSDEHFYIQLFSFFTT